VFTHNGKKNGYIVTTVAVSTLFLGALSSCQKTNTPTEKLNIDERGRNIATNNGDITPYPSVLELFTCKPSDVAFVAAHRGTHESSKYPENTVESLQALHENGVQFAEIDVARLKDGTQFLFHDGTWDLRSTGTGPITMTTWEQSQQIFLKDTNGKITSIRPSSFADILAFAKDKIYLEIDFQPSVDEAKVLNSIRDADMTDQVILISHNAEQALRLYKLAPKMALSVGIFTPGDIKKMEDLGIPTNIMTVWTGEKQVPDDLAKALRDKKIPIIVGSFDLDDILQASGDFTPYTNFAIHPDLVVSDFAFDAQETLQIKGEDKSRLDACLKANK